MTKSPFSRRNIPLKADFSRLKLIKKADIIIIVSIVFASLVAFPIISRSDGRLEATVTIEGKTVCTIDLSASQSLEFRTDTEPSLLIKAENGEVWIEEAGCKDKICVACGRLSRKGDTAVCLPAKTVICVGNSELDAVTY